MNEIAKFVTNLGQSLCLILCLKSRCRSIMPLFSSSSPFDQDVGECNRTVIAFLVGRYIYNNFPFYDNRESDEWTQYNGRLATYYGDLWSNSKDTVWVCRRIIFEQVYVLYLKRSRFKPLELIIVLTQTPPYKSLLTYPYFVISVNVLPKIWKLIYVVLTLCYEVLVGILISIYNFGGNLTFLRLKLVILWFHM